MSLLDRTDYSMSAEHAYATYLTRLASFATSIPIPTKKRTSYAKGTKSITWPHKRPSPEELALAGFYYKPSAEAPDNTICYMCERQLDGWEEDDDPVVEHLKHSDKCGWAILMDVMKDTHDVANMEDPTQSRIVDARTGTFEHGWPHEAKRGWVCKTEKMVQAGWHFAATPDSDDFVSCAYCKLSLDGWEPKDNPFDEHYRRSPDCPFFAFAGTTAPKAGKGKKTRVSKASRESTIAVASEVPSIPDLNESIDTSTVSVLSTASTMGKGKNARGKAKAARQNKAEEAWGLQPEHSVIVIEDEPEPVKPMKGKKRGSEQISQDRDERESTARPEPPAKRRNTRARDSVAQQVKYPTLESETEAIEVEIPPAKVVKGGRKRASTTTRSRKNSGTSVASLRATVPENAAIEAALEAELDKPLSDEELAPEPEEKPKRGRSKKAVASKDPTRAKKAFSQDPDVRQEDVLEAMNVITIEPEIVQEPAPRRGRKAKVTTKTTRKRESNESIATAATNIDTIVESSIVTAQTINEDSGHETDASVAGKSRSKKGGKKKTTAKAKGKKGLMSKNIEDIVQQAEQVEVAAELIIEAVEKMDVSAEIAVLNAEIEMEEAAAATNKPVKKAGKGKKSTKTAVVERAPHLSMPGAFSPMSFREQSIEPSFLSAVASDTPPIRMHMTAKRQAEQQEAEAEKAEEMQMEMQVLPAEKSLTPTPKPTPRAVPPLPPRSPARTATPRIILPARATPTPTPASQLAAELEASVHSELHSSPQSSDAENAPPSSRPASVRPPLMNPMTASTRVQINFGGMGPGTPAKVPVSPSKIGGGIRSLVPWREVDVEMVFNQKENEGGDGKEGEDMIAAWMNEGMTMSERERGMSVQEWIFENARRAEEALRREGERVVGVFEEEGGRALGVLEAVECV